MNLRSAHGECMFWVGRTGVGGRKYGVDMGTREGCGVLLFSREWCTPSRRGKRLNREQFFYWEPRDESRWLRGCLEG